MSNKLVYILAGCLLIVGSLAIYQKVNPEYIVETKTTTVLDSTKVDSLQKVIQYLESIPPETTYVDIEIPIPTQTDSTFRYRIPYSDSLMTALWTLEARGELVSFDYEYYYRYRFVREIDNRVTETQFFTTSKIITRTKKPNAYLSLGGELSLVEGNATFSPIATYTLKDGQTFGIKYDLRYQSFSAIYTRPIRFRLPF